MTYLIAPPFVPYYVGYSLSANAKLFCNSGLRRAIRTGHYATNVLRLLWRELSGCSVSGLIALGYKSTVFRRVPKRVVLAVYCEFVIEAIFNCPLLKRFVLVPLLANSSAARYVVGVTPTASMYIHPRKVDWCVGFSVLNKILSILLANVIFKTTTRCSVTDMQGGRVNCYVIPAGARAHPFHSFFARRSFNNSKSSVRVSGSIYKRCHDPSLSNLVDC